jgi:hypothetical protein
MKKGIGELDTSRRDHSEYISSPFCCKLFCHQRADVFVGGSHRRLTFTAVFLVGGVAVSAVLVYRVGVAPIAR